MTKAIRGTSTSVERGAQWATARRSRLVVEADRLVCRDWVIPFSSIDGATVQPIKGLAVSGMVLVVRADELVYQFGLNSWCHCLDALPLDTTSLDPRDLFPNGERRRTWGKVAVSMVTTIAFLVIAQVVLGVLFGSPLIALIGSLALLAVWSVIDGRRELRKLREDAGSS
jgi:hypothetical protein